MLFLKRLQRRIAMWFFVRKIGKLAKAYKKLSQKTERAAFLMENFGIEWQKSAGSFAPISATTKF